MISNVGATTFEHIEGAYYRCRFGEVYLIIDNATGYVNGTSLCTMLAALTRIEPRNLNDWYDHDWDTNESADQIFCRASEIAGISVDDMTYDRNTLAGELKGTYIHRTIVVPVATWISATYALDVHVIMKAYISSKYIDVINSKDEAIAARDNLIAYQTRVIENMRIGLDQLRSTINNSANGTANNTAPTS